MALVAHVPEHGPCGPLAHDVPGHSQLAPFGANKPPLTNCAVTRRLGQHWVKLGKKTFIVCILLVPNIGIEKFFKAPPAKQPTKKPQAPPGVAPAAEGLVDAAAITTGTATNGGQEQVDVDSRKPPKPAFQPLGDSNDW